MKPAPLPADVLAASAVGTVSPDKSQLREGNEKRSTWFQGFDTAATPVELKNYYVGLLQVKGFKPNGALSSASNKLDASWKSADGRFTVRVYSSDATATGEAKYVLQVKDLGGPVPKS